MPTNLTMKNILRGTEVPKYQKMKSSRNRDNVNRPTAGYSKGQVQNVKSSNVYVFGDENIQEDEIVNGDFEMMNIRSRSKKGNTSKTPSQNDEDTLFFDKEVQDGDSLQSLSVQFACPVSELKRINHIIQDQEFFGLRYVKVPVKRYGILSETLDEQKLHSHRETTSGATYNGDVMYNGSTQSLLSNDESDSNHDFSDPEMQMKIIRTLSIKENMSRENNEAEAFLKSMDKDLQKVRASARDERGSLNEVISVLTNKSVFPLQARKSAEHLNGADCGMRWWSISLILFFVVIVLPVGYVIYHFVIKT